MSSVSEFLPASRIDPFSQAYVDDELVAEEELRNVGRAVWLPQYKVVALSHYEDVVPALRDWETFSSARGVGLRDIKAPETLSDPGGVLELDPPDQTQARRVYSKVLTREFYEQTRERFRAAADDLITEQLAAGEIDGVQAIATAYPMSVFPDALGVTAQDRQHLLATGTWTFNSFGPENEPYLSTREAGLAGMNWTLQQGIPGRCTPEGLVSTLHREGEGKLPASITTTHLGVELMVAGIDTTITGIAWALYFLATQPDQWAMLKADPTLARACFEETLRLSSPVRWFARHTTRDVDIAGTTIPADTRVMLMIGSANRDPQRWERPVTFDITRDSKGQIAFGFGVHACVGAMIARIEAEAVLTALVRRADQITLVGEPTVVWSNTMRALASLPMVLTPAPSVL